MPMAESPAIRVVVADDHALIRHATRTALERSGDMEVVGEAGSGDEALDVIRETRPDVALLDLRMPGLDGLQVLDRLREEHPKVKALILSATDDRRQVTEALERGATAYILKSVNPVDIPSAIRQVVEGTVFRPAAPEKGSEAESPLDELTDRERTILEAVAKGHSTKVISRELWVSEKTVKFHLSNIYRKLGVPNRASAVRLAFERGLVRVE